MLERLRDSLLSEAWNSPSLLSDLAGLEQYVAESYDARSFVELLQNADDAGAQRFLIHKSGEMVFVANDGHPFTSEDFESLCRSAASNKRRGESIGYRGIGFKSVVGFAQTVYLLSDDLEAVFSRRRTREAIPEADRVPLIRIPHILTREDKEAIRPTVEHIQEAGFNVVFGFTDLVASGIEAEFSAFDETSLLFLRNIKRLEMRVEKPLAFTVERREVDSGIRSITLTGPTQESEWRMLEDGGISLALRGASEGSDGLDPREAVVHAFLPTHEPTGLNAKINGDFSTDPSRTRLVMDERTAAGIEKAAGMIAGLLSRVINGSNGVDKELINAVVPIEDPRITVLQRRSFRTELLAALRSATEDLANGLLYRPGWLNAADFQALAERVLAKIVLAGLEEVDGLLPLLKFLGAREARFDDLRSALASYVPSRIGAVDLATQITRLHATGQLHANSVDRDWRMWVVDGDPLTLDEAVAANMALDRDFLDAVVERIGAQSELRRLCHATCSPEAATRLLGHVESNTDSEPIQVLNGDQPPEGATNLPQQLSLKRWRSAEQQVLSLLNAQGWDARDVSRQNVGYDIEATRKDGQRRLVEVKAIERAGQAFTLTTNEETTARLNGQAYYIAVARQTGQVLEVSWINDPTNSLELVRQCRQWVWECSSYEFEPERFMLEE